MKRKFCLSVFMLIFSVAHSKEYSPKQIDVAIIGSGCAGLGAALVVSEYSDSTYIFSGPYKGGSLNVKTIVGNWPGISKSYGDKIMETFLDQVESRKAKFLPETIVRCDFSKRPFLLESSLGSKYLAKSVLITTGTKEKPFETTNTEKYKENGIWTNDYLFAHFSQIFEGVKGKNVVVVGGGEDAMKKAVYAIRAGAEKVYIIVRSDHMKISKLRMNRLRKYPNIEILYNSTVTSFLGSEQKLQSVEIQTLKGKRNISTENVIISVGRVPNSSLFQNKLETDKNGFIYTKCNTQQTSIYGVFAAGDVTESSKYGQGAIAAGDGMKAGYEILDFLLESKPSAK